MRVIKIPSSQGGLKKAEGSEMAPDIILENTKDLFMSEDSILPVFDVDSVGIASSNIEETNKNIYEKALDVLRSSARPIFLGGDHSVTYPIVKAFSEVYSKNPGIIIFDAHPDAENDFMPPSQEDLLCALVNQKIIKKENIILVGTRNWDRNEIEFLKKNRIKFFSMKEIAKEGIQEVSESLMAVAKDFSDLYVSIDIDVLDPAFAPGTGYIEPGGLSTRELLFFLHRLKKLKNLRAYDLMEISPAKDINGMTCKAGAKILVELSYSK
ncbi:arginase family protein [Candidatus Woesearchaeota archaeon]|nr:arginase family protein [Candidatus Woesearchaeota archaeon]